MQATGGLADLNDCRACYRYRTSPFSKTAWPLAIRRAIDQPLTLDLVLPVVPLHIVDLKITRHGYADGRKETALPKLREQSKSFQLILYGILEFGKTQLDPARVQCFVQF